VGEREEPFDRLRGDILRRMSRAQVIEKKEREWRWEAKSEEMWARRHFAESEEGVPPLFFVSDRNKGLEVLSFVSVLK
jgi:hypothetical protein